MSVSEIFKVLFQLFSFQVILAHEPYRADIRRKRVVDCVDRHETCFFLSNLYCFLSFPETFLPCETIVVACENISFAAVFRF